MLQKTHNNCKQTDSKRYLNQYLNKFLHNKLFLIDSLESTMPDLLASAGGEEHGTVERLFFLGEHGYFWQVYTVYSVLQLWGVGLFKKGDYLIIQNT